ncbi:hypothetical protein GLOIN_2v1139323 [Rhizophagus irregularis DAOM 181602=DAOM 197198]|uniref:Uncharacterized protein n=1 Tax=Rhizophagus irregularis (strain DAOM 181602 / DAOM 197198 / MUCL 43194) TaxID=747089 RepID=A0A2P4QVY3_RHIID|nr:hypothetical protein GLOIN_2v1139323 [Rhizophagus irregularis DAOM 181602=DAOM 197198]POG81785.1 hypothetical protein GLOIN_2v1139323 [Rhizophagus irregularis DAOM 181602=DAOM 197198]GET64745.1 hypothetical protein GLOIN_2v1139323 [Rhizophagus irregularis DAOM 181602=DAOM 197198]|eukprot:XP_025188651.1 hypothetical protein GLOIN_2v1139323 [Rhizophagus irregularis DAOM 181602=DAOM 197198]
MCYKIQNYHFHTFTLSVILLTPKNFYVTLYLIKTKILCFSVKLFRLAHHSQTRRSFTKRQEWTNLEWYKFLIENIRTNKETFVLTWTSAALPLLTLMLHVPKFLWSRLIQAKTQEPG